MLKLRVSHEENLMRSVDDHPGVIMIVYPSPDPHDRECTFASSPTIERSAADSEILRAAENAGITGVLTTQVVDKSLGTQAVHLSIEEAVAACETEEELKVLVGFAQANIATAVEAANSQFLFEKIAGAAEFAIEVRDATMQEILRRREQTGGQH